MCVVLVNETSDESWAGRQGHVDISVAFRIPGLKGCMPAVGPGWTSFILSTLRPWFRHGISQALYCRVKWNAWFRRRACVAKLGSTHTLIHTFSVWKYTCCPCRRCSAFATFPLRYDSVNLPLNLSNTDKLNLNHAGRPLLTSLRLIRTARKTGIRKLHYTLIIFNLNSWNGGQTFGQSRPIHFTQKVGHGDLRLETGLNLASLVSRIYLLWAQNMSTMAGLGVLESEAPAQVPSMPAWWQWKRKPFLCDKRPPMIGSRDPDFADAGVWPPKCGGNHRSALGMASQLVVCHPCQFESWVEAFFVIDFLQVLCFWFGWCL